MTKYREILRLKGMGLSQRSIIQLPMLAKHRLRGVEQCKFLRISMAACRRRNRSRSSVLAISKKSASLHAQNSRLRIIYRELAKSGVTLSLIWSEYCESCRLSQATPLQYTQYCNHYCKYAATTKATMRIQRKPGERMEVDWAGQTATLVDSETGELTPVYIFVSALSCSQYTYVEGFLSQIQESWIAAHNNPFTHFVRRH